MQLLRSTTDRLPSKSVFCFCSQDNHTKELVGPGSCFEYNFENRSSYNAVYHILDFLLPKQQKSNFCHPGGVENNVTLICSNNVQCHLCKTKNCFYHVKPNNLSTVCTPNYFSLVISHESKGYFKYHTCIWYSDCSLQVNCWDSWLNLSRSILLAGRIVHGAIRQF